MAKDISLGGRPLDTPDSGGCAEYTTLASCIEAGKPAIAAGYDNNCFTVTQLLSEDDFFTFINMRNPSVIC
jgi:hypothetical protein